MGITRRGGTDRIRSLLKKRLLAAGLVALTVGALPSAWASPPALTVPPPVSGVYHAAYPDFCPTEDCVTQSRVRDFERLAGKRIAWAYFSDNWFRGIRFPAAKVRAIWAVHHTIPFIRMMARKTWDEGCVDRTYALEKILGGELDTQLRAYAKAAASTQIPLMIEFGTEANGDWFPWSAACNGGRVAGAERFRDTYRHIVTLFRAEGARNVTWVLHLDATSATNYADYYPGPRYVDWVGLSAYGAQVPGDDAPPFQTVFDSAYRALAATAPGKPVAVLEFGTIAGPHKARWIADALHVMASGRYPRLKAESYWDSNWTNDGTGPSIMRIDSSPQVLAAYRAAVRSPTFVGAARVGR
jgi:hypothetical protein